MPSGGHAHTGPAPDPNALRRNRPSDQATWRHLPSAGRQGETPAWPLSHATARELTLWAEDWKRPQAIIWEEAGQQREVAMYVRALVIAERPKASVAQRTLVRQYSDGLGLSLCGLRLLRWIIDPVPEEKHVPAVSDEARISARARFSVVENDG